MPLESCPACGALRPAGFIADVPATDTMLAAIHASQKSQAESLRDARGRLQMLEAIHMRGLERMERMEIMLRRIEDTVSGGHQSKAREPTVSSNEPETRAATADDIERALRTEGGA